VTVAPLPGATATRGARLVTNSSNDNFAVTLSNSALEVNLPISCPAAIGTATVTLDRVHRIIAPDSTNCDSFSDTNALSGSPSFVDPSTNDYRPRFDSPLMDAAGAAFPTESDRNGVTRDVDGNGDGTALADVGAFEYPRRAPTASATATPASVTLGNPLTFSGTGSSDPDPGDILTYTWSFDDGASANGQNVTHAFATPGGHAGTLTVRDPTGLSATGTATATVEAPPQATQPATGRRKAALKKCKKIRKPTQRAKCLRKAKRLPL
jgi:PKD repeat protein